MAGNESRTLIKGALLLTLAGLVSKVLSAGYRIPLQNLTGDIGFYIYQQVYPLLGMGLVLSLYGFPSAISKLTAESKANGKTLTFKNFHLPIFFILLIVMGGLASFIFVNAERLSLWVGDEHLSTAYQMVALSLLIIPFTAMLRGIHQGNQEMKPTAYSQVGEQLIRVTIIIVAAVYVSVSGASLYRIGESAAIASLFGGLTAFIILLLFTKKNKPHQTIDTQVPWGYYIRTVLLFGFVASLNHMVLLLIQFADAFTLIPTLMDYGLPKIEAMEAKGVLDRGQPLIQLGTVLGSSFALAMIPSISRKEVEENPREFYQNIRSSMAFSLYLAVGATAGLIAIMREANILLFQDDKGTMDLQILVLAILFCSTAITASTILQGLGFVKRTAVFILFALFIKWLGNGLNVPILGITGSALATILSLFVFFLLVMFELRKKLPELALIRSINWLALFLATLGMILYIQVIDLFVPAELSRREALLYVLMVAGTGAIIYFILLLRGRAFTAKQIHMLPLSKLWIRIYKERKQRE